MTWYLGQPEVTRTDWAALQDAFKERYFFARNESVEADIGGMVDETEDRSVRN